MNISPFLRYVIMAWMSRIFSVFYLGTINIYFAFVIFDNGLLKLNVLEEQYALCLA